MELPWARFSPWTLSKQRCRLVKRCFALLPLVCLGSVALPLVRGICQTLLGHFNSFVSHDVRSLVDASSSVPGADRGNVRVRVFTSAAWGDQVSLRLDTIGIEHFKGKCRHHATMTAVQSDTDETSHQDSTQRCLGRSPMACSSSAGLLASAAAPNMTSLF